MTCKDCLYNGVCFYQVNTPNITKCPNFKDKSRYIEFPCKVGDRVYTIHPLNYFACEATVKAIYYTEDKKYYPKSHIIIQYDLHRGRSRVNFSEFGKTVFLTKEEAEKALAERSNR